MTAPQKLFYVGKMTIVYVLSEPQLWGLPWEYNTRDSPDHFLIFRPMLFVVKQPLIEETFQSCNSST